MRVLVTGSGSHLSKVLLPALCKEKNITIVTGIDINPTNFQHPKFKEIQLDVRDRKIHGIIAQHDAVIHTAFVVLRSKLGKQRKNRNLCQDININGSINVFRSALENKLNCLIHISSASVYGALPNNPEKITEQHPRRLMKGFSYAEDKNTVEDWLDENENKYPTRIIRFRPNVILGPNAQTFLLQLLKQPFYPYFKNPQPTIQCVWENDVADAIIKALLSDKRGIYNLAANPETSFKQLIKATHKFAIPAPLSLSKLIQSIAWKFSGKLEEPGWIDGMRYSLTLDVSKVERDLNWKASRSSLQCAIDALKK